MAFTAPNPRRIYKNNLITDVVLQVRFPPILRIESDVPSI
ncbi:hypothetical protein C7391_0394 [Methanimicrococcus blatticola]|uniref:Uncharacterized protein n=1 Tax=Methanimicrococcus blatticola TaxID=91560 RepID=A0A484F8T6_9EURY|nr:hypothetical protein C7391_0394 [Methanimicrococcus blatticola]